MATSLASCNADSRPRLLSWCRNNTNIGISDLGLLGTIMTTLYCIDKFTESYQRLTNSDTYWGSVHVAFNGLSLSNSCIKTRIKMLQSLLPESDIKVRHFSPCPKWTQWPLPVAGCNSSQITKQWFFIFVEHTRNRWKHNDLALPCRLKRKSYIIM